MSVTSRGALPRRLYRLCVPRYPSKCLEMTARENYRGVWAFESPRYPEDKLMHVDLDQLAVVPLCPFFASYIRRHAEYQDLVHPEYRHLIGPT